jgi:hypothetical protein
MIRPSDDTPQYSNAVGIIATAFLHTARHGRPSPYVNIRTSNRVTTLTPWLRDAWECMRKVPVTRACDSSVHSKSTHVPLFQAIPHPQLVLKSAETTDIQALAAQREFQALQVC